MNVSRRGVGAPTPEPNPTQSGSTPPLSGEVDANRYEIERKLGEGGAGAVFLARDRETGERVALKKLFRMDARSVLRLKREFRSLVDLAHPHIVKLYDMGRATDSWFLTMEYLDGVDLTTYLRGSEEPKLTTLTTPAIVAESQRLVTSFHQLARAIQALHHAGILHRDLKPTNVMVVNDRVVMLDFGLVRDLREQSTKVTEDGSVAGTPAYMAPEQLRASELGPASDWYAFGVMLYEALAGELPFDGTVIEILRGKLEFDPPRLSELAPGVSPWLSALCMALLQRDPAARPSGEQVLAAFEHERLARGEVPKTATENLIATENESRALPLVGRRDEVAALWRAFRAAEANRAVVAHVRGPSGTGKSSIVEHFLDELESELRTGVLVLRSRCYELEQMPFKALDALLDALVRHLLNLTDLEVAQVLPHDIGALSQIFPALERLPAVKHLTSGSRVQRDAIHERQRAEQALTQLLDRLAARQPIVLWIDDLQWGDLDSARILRSWLEQPASAPILFLFSYRGDEMQTSSCLTWLLARDPAAEANWAGEHVVEVATLGGADIQALCEQRLLNVPGGAALVAHIVREAQGSPFLASQLVAFAEAKLARGDADAGSLSIDGLVAQTAALLPDDAKTLLGFLSVAGRPMVPKLALQAAGIRSNGRAMVHALRGLNLVRTRDVGGTRMLEVYHDRVRERVQATLSKAESAAIHRGLFDTLVWSGQADADWLHTLAFGAGLTAEALEHGKAAAERANATLAFERAAELYRRCLELAPAAETPELWEMLAHALVLCRRGVEAAGAYLKAAEHAAPARALRMKQLAASHLLRSGRFEHGNRLVQQVLAEMQASVPDSEGATIAAIVWERTRLKLRGMSFKQRSEADVEPCLLARHDTFDAFAGALQQYDPLRSTLLQERGLRSALDAGEARRIVRALGFAAVRASMSGENKSSSEADALLSRAATLAEQCHETSAGYVHAMRAVSEFMLGRLQQVVAPSLEADRILRTAAQDDPNGDYYLRFAVAAVRIGARLQLGDIRPACDETHELMREALATNNVSLQLTNTLVLTSVEQIEGRYEHSRARLDRQAQQIPDDRFGLLHALHSTAVMFAACATGEYDWAQGHLDRVWARWLRSPIRGSGYLTLAMHSSRARMMLNRYFTRGRLEADLAEAQRDLKVLRRHWSVLGGQLERLESRLAYARGDRSRAIELLRSGIPKMEARGLLLEAERDRFALGALIGGSEGQAMQSSALDRLRAFGLADPAREVRAYVPELSARARD